MLAKTGRRRMRALHNAWLCKQTMLHARSTSSQEKLFAHLSISFGMRGHMQILPS